MTDKKEKIREFIRNNPNLNATETLKQLQKIDLGIRKTNFLELYRKEKNLPEPTKVKREASIPIKYRKVKPTKRKPVKAKPTKKKPIKVKIPYEKTKFGKIAKRMEKAHGISERKAIERARALLKIPRSDFIKLNRKDVVIILSESP